MSQNTVFSYRNFVSCGFLFPENSSISLVFCQNEALLNSASFVYKYMNVCHLRMRNNNNLKFAFYLGFLINF